MRSLFSWILLLAIGLLPFHKGVLQLEIGLITFNPFSLAIIGLSIVAVFFNFHLESRFYIGVTDACIILWAVCFLCSTVLSRKPVESGFILFHAVFIPIICYFVVKSLVTTESAARQVYLSLLAGTLVFGLFEINRFADIHIRSVVLGLPPIDYATLCTVGLLYLLFHKSYKTVTGLVGLAALTVCFLTVLSRAYTVMVFVSPILYYLIRRWPASRLYAATLLLSLVITILLSQSADRFSVSDFEGVRGLEEKSISRITNTAAWKQALQNRSLHYLSGLKKFWEAPLLGHGVEKGAQYFTWHSFHIEWLVFSGIAGYLINAAVFFFHFQAMQKIAMKDQLSAIGLVSMLVIILNGATNGLMHGMMPYVLFLIMGINESRLRQFEQADDETHAAAVPVLG